MSNFLNDLFHNFKLGFFHVYSLGALDHILFVVVLCVPFLLRDWKRVLVLVSTFTLGHFISLLLGVYNVVNGSFELIEFLIPLTILVVAGFNIFSAGREDKNKKLGIVFFSTLFFGVIHGLAYYNELKVDFIDDDNKFLKAFEISIGVEVAQLLFAGITLIFAWVFQTFCRLNKRDWVIVVSSIVVGVIIPMLIENYPY
ncbi:HupE/UreJ family protein [Sungkyunkwania multivorans]|uniref:HupE/UreJ family protein n=1 Tax=Sungkyunkwania multivorans TaxID=1173618 RepID=A0ABW3D1S8_9FLAO